MYRLEMVIYGVEEDNDISFSLNSWEQAQVLSELISLVVEGLGWNVINYSLQSNSDLLQGRRSSSIDERYYSKRWKEGHISIRERYVDTSII